MAYSFKSMMIIFTAQSASNFALAAVVSESASESKKQSACLPAISFVCDTCMAELGQIYTNANQKKDEGSAAAEAALTVQQRTNFPSLGSSEKQNLLRKAALGNATAAGIFSECSERAAEGLQLSLLSEVKGCLSSSNPPSSLSSDLGKLKEECTSYSVQAKGLTAFLQKNALTVGLTATAAALGGGILIGKAIGSKDDDKDSDKDNKAKSASITCATDETLVDGICKTSGAAGVSNQSTQEALQGVSTTLGMNVGSAQNLVASPSKTTTPSDGNTLSSGQGTGGTVAASGRGYADSGSGASGGGGAGLTPSGTGSVSSGGGGVGAGGRGYASGGSYGVNGGGGTGALSSEGAAPTQENFVNVKDPDSVSVIRGGKSVWVSCAKEPGLAACRSMKARQSEVRSRVNKEVSKYQTQRSK